MYNEAVYADRLRYQLTMFEVFMLIGLSRLLDTYVAYQIAILKITIGNWVDAGNYFPSRTVVKGLFRR